MKSSESFLEIYFIIFYSNWFLLLDKSFEILGLILETGTVYGPSLNFTDEDLPEISVVIGSY
jgi:hypothetical protein